MGTPAKERMRKLRQKREGRSLSVWLAPEAERKFRNIKLLTNTTNDAIINMAINEVYDTVFLNHCYPIIANIKSHLDQERPDSAHLTGLYRKLIKILRLDYSTENSIKDTLNRLDVPNYSGKTGTWKVSQVRALM